MDEGSSLDVDIYGMDGIVEGGTMRTSISWQASSLDIPFSPPSRYTNDTA